MRLKLSNIVDGNILKSEIWRVQLSSLARGGCTVAEHSPHHPGIKGSSSAAAGSTKANGREPKSCLGRVFNFKLGHFVMYVIAWHIQKHALA
jgi:hypothetical protein